MSLLGGSTTAPSIATLAVTPALTTTIAPTNPLHPAASTALSSLGGELLFRHAMQFQKRDGELLVTTNGLILVLTSDPAATLIQLVWASLLNLAYSPATDKRTAIMLKTTIQGSESMVVQLMGGDNAVRISEHGRLKSLLSCLRPKTAKARPLGDGFVSSVSAPPTAASTISTAASTMSTAASTMSTVPSNLTSVSNTSTPSVSQPSTTNVTQDIDNESNSLSTTKTPETTPSERAALESIRKQVLAKNPELEKRYNDLVTTQNLLSPNDFWVAHSDKLANEMAEAQFQTKRGQKNFVWSDIMRVDANGKYSVTLSPEAKQAIFRRFPVVKRAFLSEVPIKMREARFWDVFFRAELFKADSGPDTSSGGGAVGQGLTSRENIFDKYKAEDDLEKARKRKRLNSSIDPEIDLTAQFATDGMHLERLDPSDGAGGGAEAASKLGQKWNEDSCVVIGREEGSGMQYPEITMLKDEHVLHEIEAAPPKRYWKLDLSRAVSHQTAAQDDYSDAFGSSTGFGSVAPKSVSEILRTQSSLFVLPTAKEMYRMGTTHVPTASRAEKYFHTDLPRIIKFQSVNMAAQAAAGASNIATENAPKSADDDQFSNSILQTIPENLLKGLRDQHEEVTELLAHFYSTINRINSDDVDNSSRSKAEAILTRLQEKNAVFLENLKKRLVGVKAEKAANKQLEVTYETVFTMINATLLFIQRAKAALVARY